MNFKTSLKLFALSAFLFSTASIGGLFDSNYDSDEEYSPGMTVIPEVENYDALLNKSKNEKKIIMLEMSASYCGYCKTLEAEIIRPMIISGDYENVIIRKLEIDSYNTIKLPNNKTTTPSKFAGAKGVFVTPTLLFLDHKGEEVSERILGINTIEYFSAYVDAAIEEGSIKLK